MKKELLSRDLDSMRPKIIRALEHGSDYQPDWRHLQVQEYLNSIYQPDAEPLTRLDEILAEESDPFVRDLLLFHCGQPCDNEERIAYAVNCQRHNCKTLSASVIKALVIANVSPDRIAHEFGATREKIETFERLYFDARRYREQRGWLRGICFPAATSNAVVLIESRWLSVAFHRGWPGVEEVVLGQMPKTGQRTIQHPFSILLGRVEDYCFGLEAQGAAPSEKDIKALCALARIHARGLPYLWENPLEQEPSTDSPVIQELKKLSPAERDRVRFFLAAVIDAAKRKVLAQKSEGPT